MHTDWILPITYFVYMVSMTAVGIAASGNSGSWQGNSDGGTFVFRNPWTRVVFSAMVVVFFFATPCFLLLIAPNSPGLFQAVILFTISWSGGLLMLMIACSHPRELRINSQEKTYCCTSLWLLFRQEAQSHTLKDFSGICPLSGGTLLLVFRKKRWLLYGWTLGRFPNHAQALESAKEISAAIGLPLLDVS